MAYTPRDRLGTNSISNLNMNGCSPDYPAQQNFVTRRALCCKVYAFVHLYEGQASFHVTTIPFHHYTTNTE
jgi:hypothetical protein